MSPNPRALPSKHHTKALAMLRRTVFLLLLITFTGPGLSLAAQTAEEHYQTGLDQSRKGQWEAAIDSFGKAVDLAPSFALAQANRGVAFSQVGKHKEALVAFEEALHLGYDQPEFRYNRGIAFARLGLYDEAATELETALKKDSRMVLTMYDLGLVYIMQKRNDEAREMVNSLYRRNNKLAKQLYDQIPPEYHVVSVDNGGALQGRVTMAGPVPRVRSFHLIHAPNIQYCSRMSDGKGHRLLYDFTVSGQGGLKDTVIAIQGVKKGRPFPQDLQKFNIARCHSDKYVIGARNSEDIVIENTDPIPHEIATYEFAESYVKQRSNRPVSPETSQVRSAFVRHDADEFLIKCNLHPFLQTRAFMVDNPYYTVTDEEGRFSIDQIPPGTYEVVAWHPFIPNQKGQIVIEPGGKSEITFEFNSKDVRRKLYHDDLDGYRFQTWYDSFENFYGGKRVDDPVEVLQELRE